MILELVDRTVSLRTLQDLVHPRRSQHSRVIDDDFCFAHDLEELHAYVDIS